MESFKELFERNKYSPSIYTFKSDQEADDVAMELNTLGIEWSEDDWDINGKEISSYNYDVDKELKDIFKEQNLKPKRT